MSSTILKKTLKRQEALIKELLKTEHMLKGSYRAVYTKCGKTNCWCAGANKRGHMHMRLSWNDDGKTRNRAIPDNDKDWILEMTNCYKHFRKLQREVTVTQSKIKMLVGAIARRIIKNTKKRRTYLQ